MVAELKGRKSPLLVIVGSTACGKTALAIQLARQLDGELISADSWAIRRELNIGTAKPMPRELHEVPCHLINLVDVCQDFSAAAYKREAVSVIKAVSQRQKLPILVGGSGLYIDAVLYDYSFLPRPSQNVRDALNSLSLKELQSKADLLNLPMNKIDERNKRRVIRLIETKGAFPEKQNLRSNTLIIGLEMEHDRLVQAIRNRVQNMLDEGLEEEVRHLSGVYGWHCEGLKGIGYHEWKLYFENRQNLEQTRERIIQDTLSLSKRQKTWFRRNMDIHWFSSPVNYPEIVEFVTTYFA